MTTGPKVIMRLTRFGPGRFLCPNTFEKVEGWGFHDVMNSTHDGLWKRTHSMLITEDLTVYSALGPGATIPLTLNWDKVEGDSLTSWLKRLDEDCQERGMAWYPDKIELMRRDPGSTRRTRVHLLTHVNDAGKALLLKLAWI